MDRDFGPERGCQYQGRKKARKAGSLRHLLGRGVREPSGDGILAVKYLASDGQHIFLGHRLKPVRPRLDIFDRQP